jgi:hypothetical protein
MLVRAADTWLGARDACQVATRGEATLTPPVRFVWITAKETYMGGGHEEGMSAARRHGLGFFSV